MSELSNKKERQNTTSRRQTTRTEKRIASESATHLDHIAVTRNMPPRKQVPEAPIETATGLGGSASAGARQPGTINEVPLTTATGTVSESEQRIAASPYGKVLPPQLTPEGKFKCRCCKQLFDTSEAYATHYRQTHLQ